MDHTGSDAIKKHVRAYVVVFVSLMALTIITVAISTLHLEVHWAIIVALIIASIKASLVAAYFMHLISEKKVIYAALTLTVLLFIALMTLPVSHYVDRGI